MFRHTLEMGAGSRDFFGFAQGKEDDRYIGFTFGRRTTLSMDASLLLIEPETAAGYAEAQPKPDETDDDRTGTGSTPGKNGDAVKPTGSGGAVPSRSAKRHFYGSIELDAIQAKRQFADLVDEVILQFTAWTD